MFRQRISLQRQHRIQLFTDAWQHWQAGQLGDAAALKSAALGTTAYPNVGQQLAQLRVPLPEIHLPSLRAMPQGTFGFIYAQHMDTHGLTPLIISPEVKQKLHHSILGVRYALTHDIFHVLLAYDTSFAGEMGVWSFVAAQHYSPSYNWAAVTARILYRLLAPHQWAQIQHNDHRSQVLARHATCLIAQPFEEYWHRPLDQVRSEFKLGSKDA